MIYGSSERQVSSRTRRYQEIEAETLQEMGPQQQH